MGENLSNKPVTGSYHRAKTWEIAFFAFNNSATNLYMFLMGYISYYATGIAGLGVAIVGIISTGSRIWDGITDPIIGFLIDRTNGKLGKFRPFMLIGNIILGVMVLVIYGTVHLVPENFRLIYYILCYMIYIIGYTFQTACTKAGQVALTNDPSQRPAFTLWDTIYTTLVYSIMPIIVSGPLYNYAGGFTESYFMYFCLITIAVSFTFTILAIIGISSHDKPEFFDTQDKEEKVGFKFYLEVLKKNRALQMLVISAASDKLTVNIATNSVLMVVLFGIFLGNYSLYGTMSAILIVPGVLISIVGVKYAAGRGMRKTLIDSTLADVIITCVVTVFLIVGYVSGTTQSFVYIVILMVLYGVLYCVSQISGNIVIPMIADCADYEQYRSGKYVPGMIGTLFSFVDKLVSSLSSTIVSLGLVLIGYSQVQPVAGDELTQSLFIYMIIMLYGTQLIGWIINLIAMKYYPLTKEKMIEVEEKIGRGE